MSQWSEWYKYISEKIESARRLIDIDENEKSDEFALKVYQKIEQSRAEQILQKMAQAVAAILSEEIIRTPSGKAFVPEKYVIFLNAQDDHDWQAKSASLSGKNSNKLFSKKLATEQEKTN